MSWRRYRPEEIIAKTGQSGSEVILEAIRKHLGSGAPHYGLQLPHGL